MDINPNEKFIQQANHFIINNNVSGHFYIIVADITGFHTVNHVYGTSAGDALLYDLKTLLYNFTDIQLCSRIFADFFLCLSFAEDGQDAGIIMDKHDRDVQLFLDKWQSNYPACHLKAAFGVCIIDNGDISGAVDNANAARKAAKKYLATKTVLYDDALRKRTSDQYAMTLESYYALLEDRFCFYLQPKVDLTSGEIIGAEALARRIGKNGEIFSPDTFLETMENSGTIIELDRIICRQVCEYISDRLKKGQPVVRTSVNLSRLHIQDPSAADELHSIVTMYNVPAELLEFELTETILVSEFSAAKQLIDQLRGYGYHVSIDDFGSGYTGITIWQELNFDCLKLDRKFLSDKQILKERNEALVPNIINIAQRLHVQVICEGVETKEHCMYLLRLGCTIVQGFYFSKPMPPGELYELYENQDKKYPLPAALLPYITKSEQTQTINNNRQKHTRMQYLTVVFLCAIFMGSCVIGVLTALKNFTQREFSSIVIETLDAYTDGQRENTRLEINGIINTLHSMAVLFSENNDSHFINTYLMALNEENSDVVYEYFTYDNYKKQLSNGTAIKSPDNTLEKLLHGETVVSEIIPSKRMGDIYCVGLGVPIIRNGEFIGAVRGTINAEKLVSTDLYDPTQGEVIAAFLTDSSSKVIPTHADDEKFAGKFLIDRMKYHGIDENVIAEIHSAYLSGNSTAKSMRIGVFDGDPYYFSITGLGYNDWYLVVCVKADKALAHLQHIVYNTSAGITGLIIAVMLTSVVTIIFIRWMQQRFSMEEERYLLLERFSDTVLFDYDCCQDTIRLTSNAVRLMRIHELTQNGFIHHLEQVYVYAGDQDELKCMFSGQSKTNEGEIRIRMIRPESETYFWCLVQYKYIYENNTLTTIIGKITDIDEHMRSEEHLLHMSETDGLTGLLNKAASENLTSNLLEQSHKGIMFVIDADNFKRINDKYGHSVGDIALQFIANCIQRTFRTEDVIGRIGGDEMLVFAKNLDSRILAEKKAELLMHHLEACTDSNIPPLTVSIGIAIAPADGEAYSDLFKSADKAMYTAKRSENQHICFYDDIKEHGVPLA